MEPREIYFTFLSTRKLSNGSAVSRLGDLKFIAHRVSNRTTSATKEEHAFSTTSAMRANWAMMAHYTLRMLRRKGRIPYRMGGNARTIRNAKFRYGNSISPWVKPLSPTRSLRLRIHTIGHDKMNSIHYFGNLQWKLKGDSDFAEDTIDSRGADKLDEEPGQVDRNESKAWGRSRRKKTTGKIWQGGTGFR